MNRKITARIFGFCLLVALTTLCSPESPKAQAPKIPDCNGAQSIELGNGPISKSFVMGGDTQKCVITITDRKFEDDKEATFKATNENGDGKTSDIIVLQNKDGKATACFASEPNAETSCPPSKTVTDEGNVEELKVSSKDPQTKGAVHFILMSDMEKPSDPPGGLKSDLITVRLILPEKAAAEKELVLLPIP